LCTPELASPERARDGEWHLRGRRYVVRTALTTRAMQFVLGSTGAVGVHTGIAIIFITGSSKRYRRLC
jgi:hypothetical protein